MSALVAQRVEMIPIDSVRVINPRTRSERSFREIVENIAEVGLKRPITVTRRADRNDSFYDLICGQGRLEAYKDLGQHEVPALVVAATSEDCLVASLVENCARRHHSAIELLQDISGMQSRGNSANEIARKTGLSVDYVTDVSRLLANGEQRLLQSVEAGIMPLSVAVKISEADDHDVQAALSSAYESGLLKGRKLIAAKKLIESRRRQGKGLRSAGSKKTAPLSADALVKAYQEDADRKRAMIRRTEATSNRLLFISEALRRLIRDETFVALLEDEQLSTIPESLAARIKRTLSDAA